ncbi:adenylyl-sulfate kinase [Paraburkholderia metrosideri]|uniref:Adenylyl-sulfate kinase n=1 Tax=Paraburkholderia metrosideri TaxID=580937 RepID=A0ABN7HD85_9BURK|nr:adenylyl-sulfate kinase [Paraburkholderia metrosideri]CAD6509665.1 putative adenylyl-sulfate kinase [Paraburkholderia metrosideri]
MSESRGAVVWMTGLSGAGKSTLADALHRRLTKEGRASIVLDGDVLRRGLNADLGFTAEDRTENLRRVAHVAALFMQQGFIAIAAVISPEHQHRRAARDIVGNGFVEVFVNTPLEVCEARDVKGLYARARRGEIPHFTGISGAYDTPVEPDVVIETACMSVDQSVDQLIARLILTGRLS